ncbi:hypothetical protein [Alloscardovia omnicolens]
MKDTSEIGYVEIDSKRIYSSNNEQLAELFIELHNICSDLIPPERQIKTISFGNASTIAVSVCASSSLSIDLVNDGSEDYKKALAIIQ